MKHKIEEWPWLVAEISRGDDIEFFFRWRQLPPRVSRRRWPITLTVTWKYRFTTADGFPLKREFTAMGDFELLLGEAVERDALAVMSLSLTGRHQRELVFHTHDLAEFSRRLNELPQKKQRYPIRIEKSDDPAWSHVDERFSRFGLDPALQRARG